VKSFTIFFIFLALWGWPMFGSTTCGSAQEVRASKQVTQRTYSRPVSEVKAALKDLAGGTSGRLPALDGFVVPGRHALDQYERPYYQCLVRVMPAPSGGSPSGGSVVQVTAKITAWYRSPDNSGRENSGYEGLESNGRIEADLLDRLQESLRASEPGTANSASVKPGAGTDSGIAVAKSDGAPNILAPNISAPTPQLRRKSGLTPSMPASAPGSTDKALEQEAKNLEEILRNQSHPTNLIAVKRDQTPVSETPSAGSKVLFLASAEDEFEVLDVNPEWVHVRISGLSRGWLRRTSIEMPGESRVPAGEGAALSLSLSDPEASASNSLAKSSPLFAVSSDEVGTFPGDWAPLKGKSVKIISVQQAPSSGRITSPQDKMRFAEGLFKEEVVSPPAEGLVVIFDAEDGGMIAATGSVLEQWRKGAISEREFWKQCFLDPPELVGPN